MSTTLQIAIVCLVASIALLANGLRRSTTQSRHSVLSGLSTMFVSFALLIGQLIPSGQVRTGTQFVFIAAAALFFFQEARLMWTSRGR